MNTLMFYKISSERQKYLGVRFFKWNPNTKEVIQVCVAAGDLKRGKGSNFGIYTIGQTTFFSNYLAMGYAIPCAFSAYDEAFKKVLSFLK